MLNTIRDIFTEKIKKEFKIIRTFAYKNFAYFVITDKQNFCVVFKSSWYKQFGNHNGEKGWGQIASRDILNECVKQKAFYCFALPGMNFYMTEPQLFLETGYNVDHLPDHVAIHSKQFRNLNDWLEEQYLENC